jgi:peptidoglycan/LPS O-acetylase OafA/YrhL
MMVRRPSPARTSRRKSGQTQEPQKSWRIRDHGLRAATVIPVVLLHAEFEILSGAYVGVDIFFVFSGYLVTSSIISELERGDFSVIR